MSMQESVCNQLWKARTPRPEELADDDEVATFLKQTLYLSVDCRSVSFLILDLCQATKRPRK